MRTLRELPEELESYECEECGNEFFVEYMPVIQEINRPSFCCYCGVEFQYLHLEEAI